MAVESRTASTPTSSPSSHRPPTPKKESSTPSTPSKKTTNPSTRISYTYSSLLAKIHPLLLSELNLPAPTEQQSRTFGESIGSWPAFQDTLATLHFLQKYFKLVVLSNTDRAPFAATNAAQLPGVRFDAMLTAQDIGSYKPDERNFEYLLRYVEGE
ncbi:MAG: hypothetical protein L6R37_008213 [Teloschistes peruensis]|nr:MAG: hypothetical protein L6R37_008213 [Teloschistes peruensis]